jgi:hypothetical protein
LSLSRNMTNKEGLSNSDIHLSMPLIMFPSYKPKFDEQKRIELLTTAKWSDYTIVCKNGRLGIHRSLVYGYSLFLDKAMTGDFRESTEQELKLPDEEIATVWIILVHIYLGNYRYASWEDGIHTHFVMAYRLADFLLMPKLQAIIFDALATAASLDLVQSDDKDGDMLESCLTPVLDLVYGKPGIEKPKDLYAWVLMHLNDVVDGYADLSDVRVESLNSRFADLGWRLFRAKTLTTRQARKCFGCNRDFKSALDPRFVIVMDNSSPRWLSCACQFRGFCHSYCEAEDYIAYDAGARCESCMEANENTPESVRVKIKLVRGSDGKIKKAEEQMTESS